MFKNPILSLIVCLSLLTSTLAGQREAQLFPPEPGFDDEFGNSVAVSGDWILVGSPENDSRAEGAGIIDFYRRNAAGAWSHFERLLAPEVGEGDRFGHSVAIDGDWAVVGSPEAAPTGSPFGKTYVFKWTGKNWVYKQTLTAAEEFDFFGSSVAIEGSRILITDKRRLYLYELSGSTWLRQSHVTRLIAGGLTGRNEVKLSGDWIVAMDGNSTAPQFFGQKVKVFERVPGGLAPRHSFEFPEARDGALNFDLDDKWMAIGDPYFPQDPKFSGRVTPYELVDGAWKRRRDLLYPQPEISKSFGRTVDIMGDRMLIGARNAVSEFASESTHVYRLVGSEWIHEGEIAVPEYVNSGFDPPTLWGSEDNFAMSENHLVYGAPKDHGFTGSLYVLELLGEFGQACGGSAGPPKLSWNTGLPRIGEEFRVSLGPLPPGSIGVGLLGTLALIPSPLDWLGMEGCSLALSLASPIRQYPLTYLPERARWDLSIPHESDLIGRPFFLQALSTDPGFNTLGLVTSSLGMMVIGTGGNQDD